jgi:hypothetical protein
MHFDGGHCEFRLGSKAPIWPRRAYVGFTSETWRSTRAGTEAAIEPDLRLALAKPRFVGYDSRSSARRCSSERHPNAR